MTTGQRWGSTGKGAATPHRDEKFATIRGSTDNWPTFAEDGTLDFEKSHEVAASSYIGQLRSNFNLCIDFPTEAQWEYAARAGETRVFYGDGTQSQDNAKLYGRFSFNQNEPDCEGLSGQVASVGSYLPNDWDFYDMSGNVTEMCLDRDANVSSDPTGVAVDPIGAKTGDGRVCRGCSYFYGAVTLNYKLTLLPSTGWIVIYGYRLCIPLR